MSCFGCFKKTSTQKPSRASQTTNARLKDTSRTLSTRKESPGHPQRQFQTTSNLVIAIDFGTTFTGVAYSHSTATATTTSPTGNGVAEKVFVIRTWPDHNQQYAEKTPTIISYSTNPPTWGGGVKSKHDQKFSKFKLGLEPAVKRIYGSRDGELGFWADENGSKEPVDVTADYLTCVHKFVEGHFLPNTYGAEFLKNQRRVYLITVPAIWSDMAKDLTRQAAARAGIPDEKLFLVTEPEAAALYCATTCEEVDLNDGDQFLVCDAGGGTVVCTFTKVALTSGSHCISDSDKSPIPN
jgi:molecular chaperone DnaK (HSP70)